MDSVSERKPQHRKTFIEPDNVEGKMFRFFPDRSIAERHEGSDLAGSVETHATAGDSRTTSVNGHVRP